MDKAKPFSISKREVWMAYKQVKANRGAAGFDGQTIDEFDKDLKNNLYRLWNRLSSGSYMPSPVRRVDIPKRDGGMRPLGIPTVTDRIAQMVVKRYLEPLVEPIFHKDSTDIVLIDQHTRRWLSPGRDAGGRIGFLIWISKASSIISIGSC